MNKYKKTIKKSKRFQTKQNFIGLIVNVICIGMFLGFNRIFSSNGKFFQGKVHHTLNPLLPEHLKQLLNIISMRVTVRVFELLQNYFLHF